MIFGTSISWSGASVTRGPKPLEHSEIHRRENSPLDVVRLSPVIEAGEKYSRMKELGEDR